MAKKILVPLKTPDRADEIVSYLIDVAKPGMKIAFLIRYPVEPGSYWRDHWVEADTARAARLASKDVMERASWEAHKNLAEEKLSAARNALQREGVAVEVELYAGSTKRAIQNYKVLGDFDWIVTTAHFGGWVAYLLGKATGPFDGLGWGKTSFLWLFRPKWI